MANLTIISNSSNTIQISQSQRSSLKTNTLKLNHSENNKLDYSYKSLKKKNYSKKNMNLINFLNNNSDKYEFQIIYDKKKKKTSNSKSNRNEKVILKLLDNNNSSEEEKSENNIEEENNIKGNKENNTSNYDFDNNIIKEMPFMIKPIFNKRHSIYFNQSNKINEEPNIKNKILKKYLSSKGIKYQCNKNKFQNSFFNSSNDAISTDTNLLNNKTYTTINTINTNYEGNYSLQNLTFNRNFKKKDLIKLGKNEYKNQQKKLIESDSENDNNNNNSNTNSNNNSNNNNNNNSNSNSNSNSKSNTNSKSNKSSNQERENENQTEIQNDNNNVNKKARRQSVFLTKLKMNILNKQLNNFKKKRSQQLHNTFNLGDDKSLDEKNPLNRSFYNKSPVILNNESNPKLLTKGSYEYNNIKTAKKIFKKQLSKIPELSLKHEKNRNSYLLMSEMVQKSNNSNLEEILDKKIKRIKKSKTQVKHGFIYFKKIIDKIIKIKTLDSYDIGMDDSYSLSSENNFQKRKKERNKTVLTLSSINFLNLKTNSVRNSRIIKLNNLKKKFIQFLQKDINFDEKDISINNIKDSLIVKTTSYLDKIYCNNNIKSDNFLSKIISKSLKYDKDVKNYILNTKQKDFFKIEKKIMKIMKHHITQSNLIKNAKNILLNFFKISLYEQIFKGKYLETDLKKEKIGNENILIKNFTINTNNNVNQNSKKKNRRSSLKSKVIIKHYSLYFDIQCYKYFNYLLFRDNPIFFEKDIDFHQFFELLYKAKKEKLKTIKAQAHPYFEKKHSLHSKLSSKNNVKSSRGININKNSSKKIIHLSKNKINIYTKALYERKRNSFLNHKIYSRELRHKLNENIIFKKKNAALFISPNNYTEQKTSIGHIQLIKEDKNYTVFKTMKIKDDILKSCSNYKEILFLYIKDNNINGFKKVFEKFKANTEINDNEGNTLLNIAVQCGFKKAVSFLLYLGANPNSQNYKLNTPLHYALSYQYFDIADLLLKNGANEELKNEEGLTAWQCVNSNNNNNICDL